jgi:hypothetical protein
MISIFVLMYFLNSTSINFCTLRNLVLLITLPWKARYDVKSGTVYRKASKDHTKHTHFVNLKYVDMQSDASVWNLLFSLQLSALNDVYIISTEIKSIELRTLSGLGPSNSSFERSSTSFYTIASSLSLLCPHFSLFLSLYSLSPCLFLLLFLASSTIEDYISDRP